MTETLADIFKEIPGKVAEHPRTQELRGKVKALCNGSEFEQAAVQHYYHKVLVDRNNLSTRLKTRFLEKSAQDLNALGQKEAEACIPGLRKTYPEGFAALVTRQESQIDATVTQFIDVQRGLTKAFCEGIAKLCGQVEEAKMPVSEKKLEDEADSAIDAELSGRPESFVKAFLEPLNLNCVLHLSDLKR